MIQSVCDAYWARATGHWAGCLTSAGCFLTYKTRAQCFPACCAVGRLGQSTAVHSSPQLSPWGGQGWEVVTQCVLPAVEAEDTNRFLSWVCKFSSLKISFPMVPVLLKTAIGGRSVVWSSQSVGFLLGTISAGRSRLLEELQSHERQPSEWTDYKMATSLFHFIAYYYFRFWRSETHYGPCNFLKIQKQMKTQIPFQSHNQLLLETIQLATFLTCISDSTTFFQDTNRAI